MKYIQFSADSFFIAGIQKVSNTDIVSQMFINLEYFVKISRK